MLMPKKPHVLFVTEKWCAGKPDLPLSNTKHMLLDSLKATKLATYSVLYYDEYYITYKKRCDEALLAQCKKEKPDLIFLTPIPGNPMLPATEIFNVIYTTLNIPTAAIWWDSVKGGGHTDAQAPGILLHILPDGNLKAKSFKNPHVTFAPESPTLYYDPNKTRDIDISHIGSLSHKHIGRAHIAALKYAGIPVFHTGGQRENYISPKDYADYYMRSKIALNFCKDLPWSSDQLKGRTFEALMCGALLLETSSKETEKWLTPDVDYVAYTSKKDLVEKAAYYLNHDDARTRIAKAGCKKATEKYNSTNWWKTVFNHIAKIHPKFNYTY